MKRLHSLFAGTAFATSLMITGPVSADLIRPEQDRRVEHEDAAAEALA